MRCEDVRPLLPDVVDAGPEASRDVADHLTGCPGCSAELGRYRMVVLELRGLGDVLVEPPPGSLERLLAGIPEAARPSVVRRVAGDERFQHAALSLGGAVVGATAVGLLWWRARRTLTAAAAGRARAAL